MVLAEGVCVDDISEEVKLNQWVALYDVVSEAVPTLPINGIHLITEFVNGARLLVSACGTV
jgi:hypothetical protein